MLSGLEGWAGDGAAAARHILDGFAELDVHPDVPDGIGRLSESGYRLTAMTNGSVALTERLLDKAGVLDRFEAISDVSGPRCWKPARAAYWYAVEQAGVQPDQALMVAVHLGHRRGTASGTGGRVAAARGLCVPADDGAA
ncbi:HAD family hydrolase [Streptomyces sp. NPDC051172]|uniref:HAD family hydrolase n=1 Tax=Streptomyces sp. NPDC051172 TaxID=3155796 RepID=UPI00341ED9EA